MEARPDLSNATSTWPTESSNSWIQSPNEPAWLLPLVLPRSHRIVHRHGRVIEEEWRSGLLFFEPGDGLVGELGHDFVIGALRGVQTHEWRGIEILPALFPRDQFGGPQALNRWFSTNTPVTSP